MYVRMGDLAAKVTVKLAGTQTQPVMPAKPVNLQAKDLKNLSSEQVIAKVGGLFTANQKQSGILASVSMAQFILESGWGKSELAQNANNVFGMKKSLSGNTWNGSTWDGKSIYTKTTQEDDGTGKHYSITADFRIYANVEASIADHAAYLLGATKGSKKRYEGLKGEKDYRKAIQIIKDGGYATNTTYVANLCSIIEKWNLTRFDVSATAVPSGTLYRVQVGAFSNKDNANRQLAAIQAKGFEAFVTQIDGLYKVQVGAYSVKANAVAQLARVKATGFSDAFISTGNGGTVVATAPTPAETKSINEVAHEVIRGNWGNGAERKAALERAGYDYTAVQSRVNELLGNSKPVASSKSIDELAHEVIRGNWGNGEARKQALTKAGYDYAAVQARVNALLG